MQFEHLVVGGTFDLLHIGHKDFLHGAFKLAKRITVGVTSDEMAISVGKKTFYSYSERERAIREYIQALNFDNNWQIIKISDVFGTTLTDTTIDAICVTRDTYAGAVKINEARKNLKMKRVEIVKLPLCVASDGKPVSSSKIRAGEISQDGLNYFLHISLPGNSRLTKEIRDELEKPQGQLYPNLSALMNKGALDTDKLISVGDQITYNLTQKKIFPALSIVDFKIERKEVFKNLAELGFLDNQVFMTANNSPGGITRDLVTKLHMLLEAKRVGGVLVVMGEEDLSVLPATVMSPLGYTILYGQRNKGIVSISVEPPTKQRFLDYFNKFEKNV